MEIFTDHDGEVVLKKYSPIGEIATVAKDYTDSLYHTLGHISCICDRDMVVSASGSPKRELWEKPLSGEMEQAMANRQALRLNAVSGAKLIPLTNEDFPVYRPGDGAHPVRWRGHRRGGAPQPGGGGGDGRRGL